jgi:hypothetical protein
MREQGERLKAREAVIVNGTFFYAMRCRASRTVTTHCSLRNRCVSDASIDLRAG